MKNLNFVYGTIKEKDKINKNPKYNKITKNNKKGTTNAYKPNNYTKVKTKGYPRGK